MSQRKKSDNIDKQIIEFIELDTGETIINIKEKTEDLPDELNDPGENTIDDATLFI